MMFVEVYLLEGHHLGFASIGVDTMIIIIIIIIIIIPSYC